MAVSLLLAGCGTTTPPVSDIFEASNLGQTHLATCDALPLGGTHCPQLTFCREHSTPQPKCLWLHNLEHGHAVLAYNCPSGCDDIVIALRQIFEGQRKNGKTRIMLMPEPSLPKRVAAITWGVGWQGDTVNAEKIAAVLGRQDERAPEANLPCAP
jgi:Protein of unknown function (DUF3105)